MVLCIAQDVRYITWEFEAPKPGVARSERIQLRSPRNCRANRPLALEYGNISEMKHRKIIEGRVRMDLPTRIFKLLVNGPKPMEGNAVRRTFRCACTLDMQLINRMCEPAHAFEQPMIAA
jgi:hypothetical protein